MPRKKLSKRLPPASTGDPGLDTAINKEIALHNRSGNMLALWVVLGMCAQAGVKLPEGVDEKFEGISKKLVKFATDGVKRARELTADVVLDTRNEPGGRSPFQEYVLLKRDADIVARVFALLMQDVEDLQNHVKARPEKRKRLAVKSRVALKKARSSLPEAKTQASIYEKVAAEYVVDPATVKRLFEQEERQAGSFAYRVLQRGPGADGTTEM